jgi:hypothetical protein
VAHPAPLRAGLGTTGARHRRWFDTPPGGPLLIP